MANHEALRKIVRETVLNLIKEKEEAAAKPKAPEQEMEIQTPEDREKARFEEDPVNYILQKYPSLHATLSMLMTENYKDYITGIYIIAPKPTTFKIVLHNNQEFMLAFMGKAYQARVAGRKYFLLTIGEKERATIAISRLLETGSPIDTKGPDEEKTSKPEEGGDEPAPSAGEEETTES